MFGYRFTAFRFQNHTFVYLHCKGYVCDMAEKYEQCDRSCQPKDDLRKRRDVKELRRRRDVSPAMSRRDVGPETFRADLAGAMYMMGGSDIDDQVNVITPKPGWYKCELSLANKLVKVHGENKVFTNAGFMLGMVVDGGLAWNQH